MTFSLKQLIMFIGLLSFVFPSSSFAKELSQSQYNEIIDQAIKKGVHNMTTEELSLWGERIIFGRIVNGNPRDVDVGRGQCPLCHKITGNIRRDRSPSFTDSEEQTGVPIGLRGEIRIKDPRYVDPHRVEKEAHPGSGRATTNIEYIAESEMCPSCFVVKGFGEKGYKDTKSAMPSIHKPPISLKIEDFIAMDTYLYTKDGLVPPSPSEIRAAYMKFASVEDKKDLLGEPRKYSSEAEIIKKNYAFAEDNVQEMIFKMNCHTCHQIPGVEDASIGTLGPVLIGRELALKRIQTKAYKTDVEKGNAHAQTAREYLIESILNPNAHVVQGFGKPGKSVMPKNYGDRFTVTALDKLVDFLLSIDCKSVGPGLYGPPEERIETICK
jgi:cytochrome c2